MSSLKTVAFVAAAIAALTPKLTQAADLPPPMLPPPPIEDMGGWYLRGDLGFSNQRLNKLDNISFATATDFTWLDTGGFDAAPLFGLGFGYQYNNWLRFDVTGEYRGKADFHALDQFDNAGTTNTNDYTGSKSEWLFLANIYFDLGTWRSITPFVGAGIGGSRNTIDHFRDTNVIAGGGGFAHSASKWNFAWALHAGLSYAVTPNFTVELAYRYVDLGDAITGDLLNLDGTNPVPNNPMHFRDITSHDLKIGVRWMFADTMVHDWRPPMVRKY